MPSSPGSRPQYQCSDLPRVSLGLSRLKPRTLVLVLGTLVPWLPGWASMNPSSIAEDLSSIVGDPSTGTSTLGPGSMDHGSSVEDSSPSIVDPNHRGPALSLCGYEPKCREFKHEHRGLEPSLWTRA